MAREKNVSTARPRGGPLPGLVRWTLRAVAVIVGTSLTAGGAAALAGGSLTELGSGAGGLGGLPFMLLFLVAVSLGIAAGIRVALVPARWSRRLSRALLVTGGALVVSFGYFVVAHALDPCLNGWWGSGSRIGSVPLCERFGAELNWHTRFHLLAHAAPAAGLLGLYA